MLTPECRPQQLERDDRHALWIAENQREKKRYAALFNLADQPAALSIGLTELWPGCARGRELWTGEQVAVRDGMLTVQVPGHGCKVFQAE